MSIDYPSFRLGFSMIFPINQPWPWIRKPPGAHVRDGRRETFGFGRYVPSRAAAAMWSLLKAEIYAKEADYVTLAVGDGPG